MKPRPASRWAALSPAYRGRLERRGITRGDYLSGVPLAVARGHAVTPEHPGRAIPYLARAIRNGIVSDVYIPAPVWARLTDEQRRKAAHDFQLAYFERGQGPRLSKADRVKRGLHPADRRVYRHRSHEQEVADVEFQQLMIELHGHGWGRNEWQAFRDHYYGTMNEAA